MTNAATLEQNVGIWRTLHERGYFENHPRYQDRLHNLGVEPITCRLNLDATHTVLEIGCGYGRLLWHLVPRVARVVGIEVSPEPAEAARELLANRAPGRFDVYVGDGSTLRPLDDAFIDRAVSFTVFQHLTRRGIDSYIEELGRVLKPGGLACLQFFCQPGGQNEFMDHEREQSISLTASEVAQSIEHAGLCLESIERDDLGWSGYTGGAYWWWWAVASKPK